MSRLSDEIEQFIKKLLIETDGLAKIQRNALAGQFQCVPSQINYVIHTRFSNEHGYLVESKRGGGGGIVIRRISPDKKIDYLTHIVMAMGKDISQKAAEIFISNFSDYGAINKREAALLKAAISDKVMREISPIERDKLRAKILKNMMVALIT